METEGSLPHSQVPATCPYLEPNHLRTLLVIIWRQKLKFYNL